MASWMVAPALDALLAQINKYAPNRSKLSDGSIGDAAHSARVSDHNPLKLPFCATPLVRARDFTHDPAGGLNAGWLASKLIECRDSRISYLIWNRQIWEAGRWQPYNGSNPHTKHIHVSVRNVAEIMLGHSWDVPELLGSTVPSVPSTPPAGRRNLQKGDSGPDVWALADFLNRAFPSYTGTPIPNTSPPQPFGPQTEGVVKEFQRRVGLAPDGIVGPQTYVALARYGFR